MYCDKMCKIDTSNFSSLFAKSKSKFELFITFYRERKKILEENIFIEYEVINF